MASYYVWSAAAGAANGTSWANAYTTLTLAFSGKVAGDVFYVAHDHNETQATAMSLSVPGTAGNPNKIICVDRGGSVPPVSADRRATAQVTTTSNVQMTFNATVGGTGYVHYDGIIFSASTGVAGGGFTLPGTLGTPSLRFDNCSLRLGSTGGAVINIGGIGGPTTCYVELNNTTMSFAGGSNGVTVVSVLKWRNTPSALIGAAVPTLLFQTTAAHGAEIECIGVDLSAAGSGKTLVSGGNLAQAAKARFIDCKLNASVTKSSVPISAGAWEMDFIRTGSAGINYAVFSHRAQGTLDHETTIVRTGGATDGTTGISWKVITTANCSPSMPFVCPVIAIWNDTTGSAKTATVEGIWGGGAVPNDDDIWLDVEYLGDASSPQGSFVNDGKADLLATAAAQTSSSETWGGSTTKFKLNVTFTAQQKGWIYARVKCAKASSTFYIDPLITLT